MTGKHRAWSWYQRFLRGIWYSGRHRGTYDPLIGTALGKRHIGEMSIKIAPHMTSFLLSEIEAMRGGFSFKDMTFRVPAGSESVPRDYWDANSPDAFLGTKPDAPWVAGRW